MIIYAKQYYVAWRLFYAKMVIIPHSHFPFPILFVPLASPKVLSFDNKKEKGFFFLYCSHLFVPLHIF